MSKKKKNADFKKLKVKIGKAKPSNNVTKFNVKVGKIKLRNDVEVEKSVKPNSTKQLCEELLKKLNKVNQLKLKEYTKDRVNITYTIWKIFLYKYYERTIDILSFKKYHQTQLQLIPTPEYMKLIVKGLKEEDNDELNELALKCAHLLFNINDYNFMNSIHIFGMMAYEVITGLLCSSKDSKIALGWRLIDIVAKYSLMAFWWKTRAKSFLYVDEYLCKALKCSVLNYGFNQSFWLNLISNLLMGLIHGRLSIQSFIGEDQSQILDYDTHPLNIATKTRQFWENETNQSLEKWEEEKIKETKCFTDEAYLFVRNINEDSFSIDAVLTKYVLEIVLKKLWIRPTINTKNESCLKDAVNLVKIMNLIVGRKDNFDWLDKCNVWNKCVDMLIGGYPYDQLVKNESDSDSDDDEIDSLLLIGLSNTQRKKKLREFEAHKEMNRKNRCDDQMPKNILGVNSLIGELNVRMTCMIVGLGLTEVMAVKFGAYIDKIPTCNRSQKLSFVQAINQMQMYGYLDKMDESAYGSLGECVCRIMIGQDDTGPIVGLSTRIVVEMHISRPYIIQEAVLDEFVSNLVGRISRFNITDISTDPVINTVVLGLYILVNTRKCDVINRIYHHKYPHDVIKPIYHLMMQIRFSLAEHCKWSEASRPHYFYYSVVHRPDIQNPSGDIPYCKI